MPELSLSFLELDFSFFSFFSLFLLFSFLSRCSEREDLLTEVVLLANEELEEGAVGVAEIAGGEEEVRTEEEELLWTFFLLPELFFIFRSLPESLAESLAGVCRSFLSFFTFSFFSFLFGHLIFLS